MQSEEIIFQAGVGVQNTKMKLVRITLSELRQSISVGKFQGNSFLDQITSIRNAGYKSESAQRTKRKLPFVIQSALLIDDKIGNEPSQHTGVVGIDLDFPELSSRDQRMQAVYESKLKISHDPFVLIAFHSPQYGLKIFVKVNPDIKNHGSIHRVVAQYFASTYGFEHDRGANGLKKYCFLSYDPDPIYNPNCMTFEINKFDYEKGAESNEDSQEEGHTVQMSVSESSTAINNSVVPKNELDEELRLDIEFAVESIVQSKKDITGKEPDWFRISHAFASIGEVGRSYFHKVSQFHPKYKYEECNDQFDYCLTTRDGRINIGTFFHYCKVNHVPLRKREIKEPKEPIVDSSILEELPPFDPKIYDLLPNPIGELCKLFPAGRRRDMLLLAMLTVLAAVFNKVYGLFFGKKVRPILFAMAIAPPASGKSVSVWAKKLGVLVDGYLQGLYQTELENHAANDGKEGDKPVPLMLFIPGNSSQSGVLQIFSRLKSGVIFETETDIVAAVFSTDFGNYSPILRALYEQEEASIYRKTGKEHLRIDESAISLFLSGTPSQLPHLIKGGADGLYSRFSLYGFSEKPQYLSPFKSVPMNLADHFDQAGKFIFSIFNKTLTRPDAIFKFTDQQIEVFDQHLEMWQQQALNSHGGNGVSVVNRLGQMIFRIAMILTVLRTKFEGEQTCHDVDFDSAMKIGDTLRLHSLGILTSFPEPVKTPTSEGKTIDRFLQALPKAFSHAEAVAMHKKFGITERSAKRYLSHLEKEGRITKDFRGAYSKR